MVFSCFTEFVIHEGKRYSPPDNMKKVMIRFSDDKNILVFKTQNGQSHYNYKGFISPTKNCPFAKVKFGCLIILVT